MFYVYKFLNSKNEVIYVGRTIDIDKRMSQHFNKGHLPEKCYSEVSKVYYTEFSSYSDMCMYEIYLINAYKPVYNTADKYSDCESLSEFGIPDKQWKRYDIGYSSNVEYLAIKMQAEREAEIIDDLSRDYFHLLGCVYNLLLNDDGNYYTVCKALAENSSYFKYKDNFSLFAKDIRRLNDGSGCNRIVSEIFNSEEDFKRILSNEIESKKSFWEDRILRYQRLREFNCTKHENYIKNRDIYD